MKSSGEMLLFDFEATLNSWKDTPGNFLCSYRKRWRSTWKMKRKRAITQCVFQPLKCNDDNLQVNQQSALMFIAGFSHPVICLPLMFQLIWGFPRKVLNLFQYLPHNPCFVVLSHTCPCTDTVWGITGNTKSTMSLSVLASYLSSTPTQRATMNQSTRTKVQRSEKPFLLSLWRNLGV